MQWKKNKGYYNLKMNKLIATFFYYYLESIKKKFWWDYWTVYLFENKELSTKSASIFNHSHLKAKEREGIELLELYINWIEYGALPQTPIHSFARPKERNQEKAAPAIVS